MSKQKYHIHSEARFRCKRLYSIKLMRTNPLTQLISFQVSKTTRNQSFHSVTSRINLKLLGSLSRSSTVQVFKVIIKQIVLPRMGLSSTGYKKMILKKLQGSLSKTSKMKWIKCFPKRNTLRLKTC